MVMAANSQPSTRNLDAIQNTVVRYYNENKEIYQQYDFYEQKNSLGEPLYTVKRKRENIESSEDYDNII